MPEGLARQCGIAAPALIETLTRFNEAAARGEGPELGKGSTSYQRYLGDAEHRPNPCLRPLEGPFYAVEIYPGDIGTSMEPDITAKGEVRDRQGKVISGLYACGNGINSIMSDAYPGPGSTLGPALTFGYVVGQSAAV